VNKEPELLLQACVEHVRPFYSQMGMRESYPRSWLYQVLHPNSGGGLFFSLQLAIHKPAVRFHTPHVPGTDIKVDLSHPDSLTLLQQRIELTIFAYKNEPKARNK
jgi:hypothetical protein